MQGKLPPAAILLIHMGLALLLNRTLGFGNFAFPGQGIVSKVLFVLAFLLAIITITTMYRARTTIDPVFPERASKLITTGIFRLSRNPIYMSLLLMLLAWIIWLGNFMGMVLCVSFVWFITKFQIRAEEKALGEKFGKEYHRYLRKVRRWI